MAQWRKAHRSINIQYWGRDPLFWLSGNFKPPVIPADRSFWLLSRKQRNLKRKSAPNKSPLAGYCQRNPLLIFVGLSGNENIFFIKKSSCSNKKKGNQIPPSVHIVQCTTFKKGGTKNACLLRFLHSLWNTFKIIITFLRQRSKFANLWSNVHRNIHKQPAL